MHDPRTVIVDIEWPPKFVRITLEQMGVRVRVRDIATIWHVDPETDGSDDSCGWFAPNITRTDFQKIEEMAAQEFDFVVGEKFGIKYADPIGLIFWCWSMLGFAMKNRKGRKFRLSSDELSEILAMAYNPADNLHQSVHAVYHGTEDQRRAAFAKLLFLIYRCYRRLHRPWYRHPKWHVHHWSIQVHSLVNVKRFLFSRCRYCGKRFKWKFKPSGPFQATGPLWFRSENAWHPECTPHQVNSSSGQLVEVSCAEKSS
jgi:hypothetical protein